MMWIYLILLAVPAVLMAAAGKIRRKAFQGLDRRQHPLKTIYPAASLLLDSFRKKVPVKKDSHVSLMLRSLCVKESISKEHYLYSLRKISTVMAVSIACLGLGLVICIAYMQDHTVKVLERAEYGKGTTEYTLDVDYRDNEDTIVLGIDELKYSESEIAEIFEQTYEELKEVMLGENESQDHVTRDLNLVPELNGVDIYWDIDDIETLDYSGKIKDEPAGDEYRLINLYATFSMDETTRIYTYPVRISAPERDEREKLIENISEAVNVSNDIHSKEVYLPEEINGKRIAFHLPVSDHRLTFLIIAFLAAAAVMLLYDRKLKKDVKKKQEQMMEDFAEIVSKLSLLYDAGLSIYGAFERIADDHDRKRKLMTKGKKTEDRYAYLEMKLALEKIKNGMNEAQAYAEFGRRTKLYAYIKLGNLLEQNLNKGTKGMQQLLKKEVEDSFEERKRRARKKGEEASTKMLVPMVMMLIVVITVIAVPALITMKM